MKPQNHRRPKFSALSDQERAIIVEQICALVDILLDLLIAIEADPPFRIPTVGWELAAARRPLGRDGRTDDNLDVARRLVDVLPPPKTPGAHYFWTYPLRPVWDKKIRTSRN